MLRTPLLLLVGFILAGCAGAQPTAGGSPGAAASASPAAAAANPSAGAPTDSPASPATIAPPTVASPTVAPAVAPPTVAPAARQVCGSPTDHVYHPYRLELLDACRTVSGVVSGVRSEADGDYHVRLTLDPQFASMLRSANSTYQHGDLILEPICQHDVTQADAVGPCSGGAQQVPIPPIGTHVSATGAYVLDHQHSGWAELHPLFEIHPG